MNPRDRGWWRRPPETAIEHYGKLAEKARLRLGERPSLLADPPQRGDGRCVNCRRSRPEIAVKTVIRSARLGAHAPGTTNSHQ
jgi:hypothetical protein